MESQFLQVFFIKSQNLLYHRMVFGINFHLKQYIGLTQDLGWRFTFVLVRTQRLGNFHTTSLSPELHHPLAPEGRNTFFWCKLMYFAKGLVIIFLSTSFTLSQEIAQFPLKILRQIYITPVKFFGSWLNSGERAEICT